MATVGQCSLHYEFFYHDCGHLRWLLLSDVSYNLPGTLFIKLLFSCQCYYKKNKKVGVLNRFDGRHVSFGGFRTIAKSTGDSGPLEPWYRCSRSSMIITIIKSILSPLPSEFVFGVNVFDNGIILSVHFHWPLYNKSRYIRRLSKNVTCNFSCFILNGDPTFWCVLDFFKII